jgi:hypothetical protein
MVTEWCKQREYSREREQLSCKCVALDVGEDDPLSLALARAHLEEGRESPEQPEEVKTERETATETEMGRERRGTTFTALDDDDFDPLATATTAAGDDETRNNNERERTPPSTLGDPMKVDEDEAETEGSMKFYEGSKYTPGMERKETWRDWRDRRGHLLSVRSFVDKAHADDESLSVVAANISFQVAGTSSSSTSQAVATTTGSGSSTAASRVQALEDAIVQKKLEQEGSSRRQTMLSSLAVRQQLLRDHEEMVDRLRLLSNDLSTAWAKNQRVVAVNIAEKTAALLEKQGQHLANNNNDDDASAAAEPGEESLFITSLVFYPAIFVFACEILDTLGDLVWERIRRKCQYEDDGTFVRSLGSDFTQEMVREEAKYTCSNWFLKIAGNKSLLGRIYLETCLSRCHHFLIRSTHQEEMHDTVFLRLAKMCKGVAHPVTSSFARMYVAKRGRALLPDSCSFSFLDVLLSDVVRTFKGLATAEANKNSRGLHLLKLVNVCLKYIMETQGKVIMAKSTSKDAKFQKFKQILRMMTSNQGSNNNNNNSANDQSQMHPSSLCCLQHFLKHLPKEFVMEYAVQLTQLVSGALEAGAEQQQSSPPKAKGKEEAVDPLHEFYTSAQAECFMQLGKYLSEDLNSSSSKERKSKQSSVQLNKSQQRQVLNMTWRCVLKYTNLDQFLKVALTFTDFIACNFTEREVNVYVQSIFKNVQAYLESGTNNKDDPQAGGRRDSLLVQHLTRQGELKENPLSEQHILSIKEILLNLFRHYKERACDLSPLLNISCVGPLIDKTFQSSSQKVEFAETLIHLLFCNEKRNRSRNSSNPDGSSGVLALTDPVAQQFGLDMCQLISDHIASDINSSWMHSSTSRRVRQAGKNISTFILACDFGGNHESHLTFLSTCRRIFHKVVEVQELCIHLACSIGARILAQSCAGNPTRHTPATLELVKGCVAFCHITIPSLPGIHPKLQLMLQAASVALMNGLVSQAESMTKSAIAIASAVFEEEQEATGGVGVGISSSRSEAGPLCESDERHCLSFLRSCASFCLLLPGHPQHGPLYVVHGLVQTLRKICAYKQKKSGKNLLEISHLVHLLPMPAAFAQSELPYHMEGVDSNDVLYANDMDFNRELQEMGGQIIAESINNLCSIDDMTFDKKTDAQPILSIIDTVLTTATVSKEVVNKLEQVKSKVA